MIQTKKIVDFAVDQTKNAVTGRLTLESLLSGLIGLAFYFLVEMEGDTRIVFAFVMFELVLFYVIIFVLKSKERTGKQKIHEGMVKLNEIFERIPKQSKELNEAKKEINLLKSKLAKSDDIVRNYESVLRKSKQGSE
jgi:hypothetical protein